MTPKFLHALRECSRQSYTEALKEIATTLFAALLPIWLGLLLTLVMAKPGATWQLWFRFMSSNEALMVSAALVGPLVYTISKKYGDFPRHITFQFPYGLLFLIISILICVFAAAMVGLAFAFSPDGASDHANPNGLIDATALYYASCLALILSSLTLLLVSALRNDMDRSAPQMMIDEMNAFRTEYDK